MEFDEHEDQEEEEMGIPEPPSGYESFGNLAARSKIATAETEDGADATTPGRKGGSTGTVKYRECQKNHAVSIGGHAVDGCCEFLAAGEEGTLEAVICAACDCHRNFHRKEIEGEMSSFHHQPPLHHQQYHQQFSPYYHHALPPASARYLHHHLATPPVSRHRTRPLPLPSAALVGGGFYREEENMSNPSSSGGGSGSGTKKRFRTKFTQEQKDKMLELAERLGWRIQKQDENLIQEFCNETGVKRQVLKVWMHNNKHTLGKKP